MKQMHIHQVSFFRLTVILVVILYSSISFAVTDVCISDFNNDFAVNDADLAILATDFGRTSCDVGEICEGDFDKDNDVDGSDLAFFASELGRNDCRGSAPVGVDLGLQDDEQQGGGGIIDGPVRILNGNVMDVRTDIRIPSPNTLGLIFRAVYNSRSTSISGLGYGWTHSYAVSLQPSVPIGPFNYLKIIDDTGREIYFSEDIGNPGTYRGAFKEKSHVVEQSGEYVWYRLDGTTLGFSTTGKLIWIDDEKGNRLSLSYGADSKLEAVTDMASTRNLTFNYNAEGLLEYITGPATNAVPTGVWVEYGYDDNQNLSSVIYGDNSGFTYYYEDFQDIHDLTKKTNKANHLIKTWSYNSDDQCENYFNRDFGIITIGYPDESSVEITDGHDITRSYTIDQIDSRKRVVQKSVLAHAPYNPNDNAIRWEYDSSMRLVEIEFPGSPNNTIHQYLNYDERGNAQQVILAEGSNVERVITYEYHPKMNTFIARTEASVLGAGDKITIYDYDDDGNDSPNDNPTNLISRKIEEGYTADSSGNIIPYEYITKYEHNNRGQILAIYGPRLVSGDIISFAYDEVTGNLVSITQPLIGITQFSDYDNAGKPCSIIDINGNTKYLIYDALGRITRVTDATDDSFVETSFNLAGTPEYVRDADGITNWFDYDISFGRLIKIIDAQNNYIAYQYDGQGNKTATSIYNSSDVRTYWQRFSYDNPNLPGMLYHIINPDETYQEYDYDNAGHVSAITDPNFQTVSYEYDHFDRPTRVTQPYDTVTQFTYDSQGNLSSVNDAENHLTQDLYDDMGRVVSTLSVDTGLTRYVYDEFGNILIKVDANENIANYNYDLLNRLSGVTFSDTSQNITYSYDEGLHGKGHLTGMLDPSGNTTFTYDSKGNTIQKYATISGNVYTLSSSYTYASRKNSITYSTGRSLQFFYDNLGNVLGVSTSFSGIATSLMENIGYLPFGPGNSMTTGTGSSVNNVYDEQYRLIISNPGTSKQINYTYDPNSNLTESDYINNPDDNNSFAYDELNRLVFNTNSHWLISYSYDKVGNRLSRTVNGKEEVYSYITETNKILSVTGVDNFTFNHDDTGKITLQNNTQYLYNYNNQLIRVEENGQVLGEYVYNGLGQRIYKQINGSSNIYHYDFDGNLIGESGSDGTFSSEYLYLGSSRLAKVNINDGSLFYYLNDHLGTPLIMTDSSGVVVWEASYDPFGSADIFPSSTVKNNFRFPGQYYDDEAGLSYNWYRNYNPQIGRYMTPDSIGLAGGINLYSYVSNNPINFVDPLGLRITQVWRPLAGGVYGLGYHTGISVNGEIYGFTADGGVVQEDPGTYNWGSHENEIYGGDEYDQAMLNYLRNAAMGNDPRFIEDTYGLLTNNCMFFAKYAIEEVLNNPVSPQNDKNGMEIGGVLGATLSDNYIYPPDWFPVLEYLPGNPDEVPAGSSVEIQILGEAPPFVWTVSGNGFSLAANETSGLSNILYVEDISCGSAQIQITDATGQTVTGYVRSSIGQWVSKGNYCGLGGSASWYDMTSDGIRDLIFQYELISGNKRQYQESATNFMEHASCDDVPGICEAQNLFYCPSEYRDENCIDGDFADFFPSACEDGEYHCFCVFYLEYSEWECN